MRLARLEIEDFALIARASLEFADGFTVCSGETGSGKTMLLGSLAFVLGERSSADIVRAGAPRARVTLAIEVDAALRETLDADGFESEDDSAILVREMLPTGKSSARINGRLATSGQLRALGERVLEAVGQHEQQRLLSRAYQLDVLDAFAGDDALARRRAVRDAFDCVAMAEAALADLTANVGRALAELEFARFAAREIDEAALVAREDVVLRERRDYLVNVEKIASALGAAHDAIAGEEGSAMEALGSAAAALAGVARFGAPLAALAQSLAAMQSETNDAAVAIARERDATDLDAGELEAATARLSLSDALKKKYGGSIDAVFEARARFETTIAKRRCAWHAIARAPISHEKAARSRNCARRPQPHSRSASAKNSRGSRCRRRDSPSCSNRSRPSDRPAPSRLSSRSPPIPANPCDRSRERHRVANSRVSYSRSSSCSPTDASARRWSSMRSMRASVAPRPRPWVRESARSPASRKCSA
jgi:DNA repair ATPase RecN